MAVTPTQLGAALEPGSVPYGERETLEQNLQAAVPPPGPQQGAGRGGAPAPGAPMGGLKDPIGSLLNGAVQPPAGGDPLTSGLTVGPGTSPMAQARDPRQAQLYQIATQASSPQLRALARNELRRLAGG